MAGLIKRGKFYSATYKIGGKEYRRALRTTSYRVAKERLLQLEQTLLRGEDSAKPTRTPLPQILEDYVLHMEQGRTKNAVRVERWYLRDIFGPVCPALKQAKKRKSKRRKQADKTFVLMPRIEVAYLEEIGTAYAAEFISGRVTRGRLAPKTANRYREVLLRLFSWAMDQRGVRMPGNLNPIKKVERRREHAPLIRYLTADEVGHQLKVLEQHPQLQTMAAVYIYAGLRREEALWLTRDDIDLNNGVHGLIRIRAKRIGDEYWEPKTKVNRAVPISSALRGYLERHTASPTFERWLFPSPRARRWDPDNFSWRLRTTNRELGLPWSCLDYRHTFGSHLASKGVSLYKISALMGNSPEICRRHYAALMPDALAEAVEFGPRHTAPKQPGLRLAFSNGEKVDDGDDDDR